MKLPGVIVPVITAFPAISIVAVKPPWKMIYWPTLSYEIDCYTIMEQFLSLSRIVEYFLSSNNSFVNAFTVS